MNDTAASTGNELMATFCNCFRCRRPCRGTKRVLRAGYSGSGEFPTFGRVLAEWVDTGEFPGHSRPLCSECAEPEADNAHPS